MRLPTAVDAVAAAAGIMALCLAEESPRYERTSRQVHESAIVQAANFAVDELKKLSDTGIYTSLDLVQIKNASTQVGEFHFMTYMHLDLASPHYKSRQPVESFSVVVMQSKADDVWSFAIDDFPVMDEDAIEMYWIDMVEKRRRAREAVFADWSGDDINSQPSPPVQERTYSKDEL
ncbi:hypothetical protein H310_01373 [Aphanomyces invadans]|uniref:Uncharacterized protein n=1 Tax=Aphanomyces invadans TaxID=157072 RepID=A0A024UTB3_9STRA|nr:hypothetical protein H310_01373 [Aphanomyces invadans]ETW08878.1 hypothetical protein H310_01373 [Aphanomyces invadans]|eukprot:XP_008862683.1 hypothetical protein H310_01373 [Aphanomyces invadans]